MSDYDYQEQYQDYPENQEEDINTKVDLEYYEIEDLIRAGKTDKAIDQLERLYKTCEEHNLKNYKIKILNQLLTIYSKNERVEKISNILSRIAELNKQEKYTENAVKSIITIVRGSNYAKIKGDLINFIENFDQETKLKSYLFLLERAIEESDKNEARNIYGKVESLVDEYDNLNASLQLEFYSLDFKYSNLMGIDVSDKIHQIELRIPKLEAQAYMSEGHISVLKLVIAQNMFESGNYENSAANIFDAFREKTKYGTSAQLKEILKVNALICMLIEDPEQRRKESINALFHESSMPFKNEADIQQLITLFDAYERFDIQEFNKIYFKVNFKPESKKYLQIEKKLLIRMKKEKLLEILKSYQSIKFPYIAKRLSLSEEDVERIVFELITDEKIHGRIHIDNANNKYLEILPPRNMYLEIQAENLRELGKRYLL